MASEPKLDIADWSAAPLGQVADFVNGRAFKPSDWSKSGTPIIRIQNLNGGVDYNYFEGEVEPRSAVRSGDLLFSWSGTRGTSFGPHFWRGPHGVLNQHIFNVRNLRGIDQSFLFYALKSITRAIEGRAHGGTGIVHITKGQLEAFEIPLPPLAEQRKIAAILTAVDEVIEKTEAVIESLQTLKKAMMQELLTRGLPGRHTRFKQTEIGEVPEEWELEPLGSVLREPVRNGYSPVCPSHPTGKWVLHLGAVGFGGFNAAAVKPAPADDPRVDASLLRNGDLLVSRSNTRERVGLAGTYRGIPSPCTYPDLLIRVRPGERLLVDFAEASLLSERGRAYFEKTARGTSGSMVKVTGAIVSAFPVALPSVGEQRDICEAIDKIKARIHSEAEVLASIQRTKAGLTSALLAGELRVAPDEDAA